MFPRLSSLYAFWKITSLFWSLPDLFTPFFYDYFILILDILIKGLMPMPFHILFSSHLSQALYYLPFFQYLFTSNTLFKMLYFIFSWLFHWPSHPSTHLQVPPADLRDPWRWATSRPMAASSSGTNQKMMVASLLTTMRWECDLRILKLSL